MLLLASTPNVYSCDATPGKEFYWYELCIHQKRQKFTKELDEKCKTYEEEKLRNG